MASPDNLHKQVSDAVQNAVDSSDFSGLQSAIERSIGAAATGIGNGLAIASANIQNRQNELARLQEKKRFDDEMDKLYKSPSFQRSVGIAMVGWGAIIGVGSLACAIVALTPKFLITEIVFVPCLIGGAALLYFGVKRLGLANKFERYRDYIGLRPTCPVDEIAASTGDTPTAVRDNVKDMISKGLFKQAALTDDETIVIMNSDIYRRYRQNQKKLRESNSACSAEGVSAAVTPQAKTLLSRGESYIKQIRESNKAITDEDVTKVIDRIERVVRTIFQRASEHPEVIDDLGQLMDYFLPTTVKLLDAYRELDAQSIQSDTIKKSKGEIEGALNALSSAYEKLLDSIFKDFTMDVSSDISVLHTVLAQEGLVDNPFEKNSQNQ